MVNGEYRYFNGGDLVFADASQIQVDKCVENFVLVSRDTLSLFLPMLKEEALKLHGNDSNLLIVFYVQIMPDDLVMQLHRF